MKKYLAIAGSIVTAILLILAGAQAQSKRASVKRKEDRAADLLNTGIKKNIEKARVLTGSALKDKEKAAAAHKRMKDKLEKLGENNEDLDAIAHAFNSKRLRKQPKSKRS